MHEECAAQPDALPRLISDVSDAQATGPRHGIFKKIASIGWCRSYVFLSDFGVVAELEMCDTSEGRKGVRCGTDQSNGNGGPAFCVAATSYAPSLSTYASKSLNTIV